VDRKNVKEVVSSKLQLVDLAGSERTHLTGVKNKESIEINKSLFVLRNVIKALASQLKDNKARAKDFIPYRDSKLTSLLKQSLGGSSYTLMIACLSPSDLYIDETVSTLKYATKANCIQNKPMKNVDEKVLIIQELQL